MMLDRLRRRFLGPTFPRTPDELAPSDLFNRWWYYTVELMPGLIAKGQYPDDFPLLPRLMLRNCDLKGASCLDLGSMEGLIPTLMCRSGASSVLATDAVDHCHEKMAAIKHYYDVEFDFHQVGLMYDLTRKLKARGTASFDVINVSGLLYHVFSPLMVLAGVRPLLKKNGLMIVSTNVVFDNSFTMHFNDGGRLQEEANTFWYVSVNALDYMLRYMKLAPIDCVYLPHQDIKSPVRYMTDVESGYFSVVCRASDDVLPTKDDTWMRKASLDSWEYKDLVDTAHANQQPRSEVRYAGASEKALLRDDVPSIELVKAIRSKTIHRADKASDAHILKLADRS